MHLHSGPALPLEIHRIAAVHGLAVVEDSEIHDSSAFNRALCCWFSARR
jgi:hypothetical protein